MNFAIENTMLLNGGGNKHIGSDQNIQILAQLVKPDKFVSFLGGGGDLYHEQYNEHGVKIENQCFP